MSNSFENPPAEPLKPASEENPAQELPKPDAARTPDATPTETRAQSPELPTDAEVMQTLSVPVPYTPEEMAAAQKRLGNDYLEPEATAPSPDEQAQEGKEELENLRKVIELMDAFELKYPLPELHAITNISLAELVEHSIRKPANAALVHIRKALALIKSIPEIDERYRRLSRAVGIYNSVSKTVDHDR